MSTPETPPHEQPPLVVVAVPEIRQIQFTDQAGEEIYPPTILSKPEHVEKIIGQLTSLYVAVGEEPFSYGEAVRSLASRTNVVSSALRNFRGHLPEAAFSRHVENGVESFRFGAFAIAQRRATDEEKAARREQKHEDDLAQLAILREQALEADPQKTDLTQYNHTVITVGEQTYVVDLDTPDTIMAARVVEALAELQQAASGPPPEQQVVRQRDVAAMAWQNMPINERLLYAKREDDEFRLPGVIAKQVENTLTAFTNRLSITRRGMLPHGSYNLTGEPITARFEAVPPDQPYASDVRTILPPGTPKARLDKMTGSAEIDEVTLAYARELVALALNSDYLRFSNDEAIDVLDLIMSQPGKRALRAALTDSDPDHISHVFGRLQMSTRSSLGDSRYFEARRNRIIAGNTMPKNRGRVRLSGGRLDASTTRADAQVLSKWTFVPVAELDT